MKLYGLLKVIGNYSKALNLLDDYDHKTLTKVNGNIDTRKIKYEECIDIINKLRFNEESSLFNKFINVKYEVV